MVGGHRHDADRVDVAGVLHRPAGHPAPSQPAHDRRLPRHHETAAELRAPTDRQAPSHGLDWDDLDATTISAFLNHLETDRRNSIRTRNLRLTAIRSLFSFAALRHPEHALLIQRVLAIPPKRFDKRHRDLPDRDRDRRPARRARPDPLGRSPRPSPDASRRPNRTTCLRADRPELRAT